MTTSGTRKKMHFLLVLHLLVVLGVGCWWGAFWWRHSPSRLIWERAAAPVKSSGIHSAQFSSALTGPLTRKLAAIEAATKAGLADVSLGVFELFLFALGTGVYVRRFEIWLQARSSGQAVALGATGLSSDALAANATRGAVIK